MEYSSSKMYCCEKHSRKLIKKTFRTIFPFTLLVLVVLTASITYYLLQKYNKITPRPVSDFYINRCVDSRLNESQPSFEHSYYFTITLVFSIGYGDMAPCTWLGKLITIIFAVIGVPIALLCFNRVGILLANLIHHIDVNYIRKHKKNKPEEDPKFLLTVIILISFAWVFIAALYFYHAMKGDFADEGKISWTYLDALYFTTITLFTVGLGDYYPEKADKYSLGMFLFVDLALVSTCIAIVRQNMERQFEKMVQLIHDVYEKNGRPLTGEQTKVAKVVLELWKKDPSGSWLMPVMTEPSEEDDRRELNEINYSMVTKATKKWKRETFSRTTSTQTDIWPLYSDNGSQTPSSNSTCLDNYQYSIYKQVKARRSDPLPFNNNTLPVKVQLTERKGSKKSVAPTTNNYRDFHF